MRNLADLGFLDDVVQCFGAASADGKDDDISVEGVPLLIAEEFWHSKVRR